MPFRDVYPGVLSQLIRQQALAIRARHASLHRDAAVRRRMTAASDDVLADELPIRALMPGISEAALLEPD